MDIKIVGVILGITVFALIVSSVYPIGIQMHNTELTSVESQILSETVSGVTTPFSYDVAARINATTTNTNLYFTLVEAGTTLVNNATKNKDTDYTQDTTKGVITYRLTDITATQAKVSLTFSDKYAWGSSEVSIYNIQAIFLVLIPTLLIILAVMREESI